jgi:hypothetical protein
LFSGYKNVYSGHYHTASKKGNITYLGSQIQFTWTDYLDQKAFHILHENETLERIESSPDTQMFFEITYSDDKLPTYSPEHLRHSYVKVIVESRINNKEYATFLQNIKQCEPEDLQVVDTTLIKSMSLDGKKIDMDLIMKSPIQIIRDEISSMSITDSEKLLMIDIINKAEMRMQADT